MEKRNQLDTDRIATVCFWILLASIIASALTYLARRDAPDSGGTSFAATEPITVMTQTMPPVPKAKPISAAETKAKAKRERAARLAAERQARIVAAEEAKKRKIEEALAAQAARERAEDELAYAGIKALAERDHPGDYSTQKYVYDTQVQAYHFMKNVTNLEIKALAERDHPGDYSTQKYVYESQVEAKSIMDAR